VNRLDHHNWIVVWNLIPCHISFDLRMDMHGSLPLRIWGLLRAWFLCDG
jgi:hypothetical protein